MIGLYDIVSFFYSERFISSYIVVVVKVEKVDDDDNDDDFK